MKAQLSVAPSGLSPGKLFVMIVGLSLFLGAASVAARSQDTDTATQQPRTPGIDLGVVSSTLNPLQIALLHWYGANQTTSFAAGTNPFGIAFDGANMWIADFGSNKVTKLHSNDGALLGSFTVGSGPTTLAFDGANIWVTDFNSTTVTELLAFSGATIGTFTVGTEPNEAAFDGTHIWVTNFGGTTVSKL